MVRENGEIHSLGPELQIKGNLHQAKRQRSKEAQSCLYGKERLRGVSNVCLPLILGADDGTINGTLPWKDRDCFLQARVSLSAKY